MADTRTTAVLERLVDDEYLQEQLGAGVTRLRSAYQRARAMRPEEAVQDKRLYEHVRHAVAAIGEAGRRALGKPEPEPPRRWRRLPVLAVALGVTALVWNMHRTQRQRAVGSAQDQANPT